MQWYVFGDLTFLADVVNGVAMLMGGVGGSGTSDYTGLIQLAMLLGVLATLLSSAVRGGGLPWGPFFAVLLVYGVAMTPKVTVTMENVYTGATRTVANVPLGIAFAGNLFSQIGLTLTETFETVYSYPGITDDGYAQALRTWEVVRKSSQNATSYAAVNTVGGGDFARSWINYVSTCTSFGLDLGALKISAIESAPFAHEAVRLENRALGALVFTGAGDGNLDCVDAHDALLSYSRTQFIPALKRDVLANLLHDPNHSVGAPSVAAVDARLSDMFSIFTGGPGGLLGAGVDADEALLSFYVGGLVQHGAMRRLQLDRKEAYAIMIGDAIRARNAQWTAQGDVFNTYVLPLLSFIEGFFYAMSPLMFVAAVIGFGGFRILSRYAMIGLWIQLWAPTLAVVQLFTWHVVSGEFANLGGAALTLTSYGGQFVADNVVQKWLATAGLFASSVPALSLLLLTGSVYTFNSLAGRIGGPDTIAEQVAAPARLGHAAQFQPLPEFDYDPRRGAVGHGSAALLPKFRLATEASATEQSAEREMAGSRRAFTEAFDRVYATSAGSELRSHTGEMWRDSASANSSEVYRTALSDRFSETTNQMRRAGLTETEIREFASKAGLTASLNPSTSGGLARAVADLSASLSRSSGDKVSIDQATSWAHDIAKSYGEDKDKSAQLMTAFASDISGGLQKSGYNATSFSQTKGLRDEASRYVEAHRSWEQARSHSASVGASREADVAYLATRILENGREAAQGVFRSVAEIGMTGAMGRRATEYLNAGHFPRDDEGQKKAHLAAGLALLHEANQVQAINSHLAPLGFHVPDVGGWSVNAGVGRGGGGGLGVDLSGAAAAAGGADTTSADRRGEAGAIFEGQRGVLRDQLEEQLAPVVQGGLREDSAAAERNFEHRTQPLAVTSLSEISRRGAGSAWQQFWDAAYETPSRALRDISPFIDQTIGTNLTHDWQEQNVTAAQQRGLTPAQAEYFAFMRAYPNLPLSAAPREFALRQRVQNEYNDIPDVAQGVVARLREAANATEAHRERLMTEVATTNRTVQPGVSPEDLDLVGRAARR